MECIKTKNMFPSSILDSVNSARLISSLCFLEKDKLGQTRKKTLKSSFYKVF